MTTTSKRIPLIVTAAVASLLAAGLLAVGGVALLGDAQKDANGYFSTGTERFATDTHALATENLDIDLDGAESILSDGALGTVRLEVSPQNGEPVFVGIARTSQVSAYLGDVAHTSVTDIDYSPFRADYSRQHGERRPAPPAQERIWAESAQGAGSQTLTWDVDDGDWSVVVMNADGSSGVQADISAGAKVPLVAKIGWGAVAAGTILLIAAGGMLVVRSRLA